MRKLRFIVVLLFIIAITSLVNGQRTTYYDDPGYSYNLGLELYNSGKFGAASTTFNMITEEIEDKQSEIRINAEYYITLCAYELFHKDAEYLFTRFIANHPENTRVQNVYFYLGNLNYRNKKYKDGLRAYSKVDVKLLNDTERSEYHFKQGYCFFKNKDFKQAKKSFNKISEKDSRYQGPANYYYAHIAYIEHNYEEALEGFLKLDEDETFESIVPYYLVNIYYLKGEYEKVIAAAEPILEQPDNKRIYNIIHLTATSLYQINQYQQAIPLYEKYLRNGKGAFSREDWYALASCYYQTNDYEKAIQGFQKTTSKQDSLSQNAFYHLGFCYIQTDEKQFASNAFLSAYKIEGDHTIKEEALFNNAQLAFELSYDPYNGAIKALKHFITNFPESKRLDEAYGYLVNLFLSTNNYKEALSSMEKIKSKDEKLKPAYQRIAHFRGVELFNDKKYNEAISYFKKSLDYNYDKEITAANYYWIAEAFHHQLSYKQAINYYDRFLTTRDAEKLDYHNLANYNLGYCWFKQKDYHSAINGFKKFIKAGYPNEGYIADASLRVGDCYFIGKRYDDAITWYDRAIKYEGPDSDYGLFQKAYALGGKGDFNQKASVLNELLDRFPGSANHDNTLFELGTTFLILNRDEDALLSFKRITNEYSLSPLIPKSLLKTGMIYYNRNSNDLAINTLKKVIEQYPGTTESHEALESLQNIYVDLNRVNDFFSYASQFPFANISRTEQDSLTYFASENLYLSGEYLPAIEGFAEYIKQFPQGSFFIHAHYYKADCEYRSDNMIEALKDYLFIINQPPNKYTETAYARAAIIEFDKEQYEQALEHFISLEELAGNKNNQTLSITGQMRCNFFLGFDEATLESAGKLIQSLNPDAEIAGEAHFVMAKSAYNLGKTFIALDEFQQVCQLDQGINAAESQYYIAEIAFINNDFQEAEKQTFELINKYPSYDYWVAKGFILLADVYIELDNAFQAKQTLQSIIDNYDGDDLTMIAKQKLDTIIAMEESEKEDAVEEKSEGIDDDEF